MKADLHIHSTVSDGSNTPRAILEVAAQKGLDCISLTEHDTMHGSAEARELGLALGVRVLTGIEFSAFDVVRRTKIHILGYGMTSETPISALGDPLLARRHENSLRQIEILRELGYDITPEEVAAKASRHIYKQHIMAVMMEKGYANSVGGETYKKLFKNGGPCDFDIAYIDACDAVRAIVEAGGVAVLAHPGQQQCFAAIPKLIESGLQGLELNHPANTPADRDIITSIAHDRGLFLTGGSDHHGAYESFSPEVGDYLCPIEKNQPLQAILAAAV